MEEQQEEEQQRSRRIDSGDSVRSGVLSVKKSEEWRQNENRNGNSSRNKNSL